MGALRCKVIFQYFFLRNSLEGFFYCIKCHYNTSSKKDYDKHLLTRKHINTINIFQKNRC